MPQPRYTQIDIEATAHYHVISRCVRRAYLCGYDRATAQSFQGVVWLTVISSAPGKQGYVTAEQEKKYLAAKNAAPSNVLLDPEGTLGQLYGAKTTPHMFIIDEKGVLVYAGAIDDKSGTSQSEVATAKNYVLAAYSEAKAGNAVTTSSTAPYGCSVKYKD